MKTARNSRENMRFIGNSPIYAKPAKGFFLRGLGGRCNAYLPQAWHWVELVVPVGEEKDHEFGSSCYFPPGPRNLALTAAQANELIPVGLCMPLTTRYTRCVGRQSSSSARDHAALAARPRSAASATSETCEPRDSDNSAALKAARAFCGPHGEGVKSAFAFLEKPA